MSYFKDKYYDKRLNIVSPGIHTLTDVVWSTRYCLMNFENNLPGNSAHPQVVFNDKKTAEEQLKVWQKDGIKKIYVQEIQQGGGHIRIPRNGGLILPVEDSAKQAALACLEAAYDTLGAVPYTGGGTAFWSHHEWLDKEGASGYYGEDCQLVLVYDGGDFSAICNMDKGNYALYEKFKEALSVRGYRHEPDYSWVSPIYKLEKE